MGTTVSELAEWFDHGVKQAALYMLVVCDGFDHIDYPVYVDDAKYFDDTYAKYDGKNMQRIMEVYDLVADRAVQLQGGTRMHNGPDKRTLPDLTGLDFDNLYALYEGCAAYPVHRATLEAAMDSRLGTNRGVPTAATQRAATQRAASAIPHKPALRALTGTLAQQLRGFAADWRTFSREPENSPPESDLRRQLGAILSNNYRSPSIDLVIKAIHEYEGADCVGCVIEFNDGITLRIPAEEKPI